MNELAIPVSLLAVIFAAVAFFYASVGLGVGSSYTALLAVGVLLGGMAGSFLGAGRFESRTMQKILGSVLVVAIISLGRKITMIVMM